MTVQTTGLCLDKHIAGPTALHTCCEKEGPLWQQQVICFVSDVFSILLIIKRCPCKQWAWITKYDLITYDQTGLPETAHATHIAKRPVCYHGNHVCGAWEINYCSISLIIISIICAGCLDYHVNRGTCRATAGRSWRLVNRGDQIKQLSNHHMWVCREARSGIR